MAGKTVTASTLSYLEKCATAQNAEFRKRVMVAALMAASEIAAAKPNAKKAGFVSYVISNPERAAAVISLAICAVNGFTLSTLDADIKAAIVTNWALFAGDVS